MEDVVCLICSKKVASNRGLSKHIKNQHNISPEGYTLSYLYSGVNPLCKCGCGLFTKYVNKKYCFNEYIHNHHRPTLGQKMSDETREKISLKQRQHQSTLSKEKRISQTLKARSVAKKNMLQKHGVENIFYLQRHTWEEILKKCNEKRYVPQFKYKDYQTDKSVLSFFCKEHNVEFKTKMGYLFRDCDKRQCPMCKASSSFFEKEVSNFVNLTQSVVSNDRKLLTPKELDIFIPSENVAIECNGLYWHSEIHKKRNYHKIKFDLCQEKGIQLFQIYEDEWRDKQEVWKSILGVALGDTESFEKLNARSLTVDSNPSVKILRKFLEENHLQGYAKATKKFVLKDDDGEIFFCITLRRPFTKNKKDVIEIARICSKHFTLVRGGFSRLMKYVKKWAKEQGYREILTYSDCRYSLGKVYKQHGFNFVGHTGVGYDYTDFNNRYNRFDYRAKGGKSERKIAEKNNLYRIYNAGNYIWSLEI